MFLYFYSVFLNFCLICGPTICTMMTINRIIPLIALLIRESILRDTIILSILNEKDRYGYEIAKTVKVKCNNMFELKEGTMYLALKRMESKGFIESYWSQEESAGGRRKYYKMTDLGKETYQTKKKEWFFIKEVMGSFLGEEI